MIKRKLRCKQFQHEKSDCKKIFDVTLALSDKNKIRNMKEIFFCRCFKYMIVESTFHFKHGSFNPIWLHPAYCQKKEMIVFLRDDVGTFCRDKKKVGLFYAWETF